MNGFIIFLLFVWIANANYIFCVYRYKAHKILGILFSISIAFIWTIILDAIYEVEVYWLFVPLIIATLLFVLMQYDYDEKRKKKLKETGEQNVNTEDITLHHSEKSSQNVVIKTATSKFPHSPQKPEISAVSENVNLRARKIEFLYENANGDIKWRTVRVISVDNRYLQAHCHDSHEERTFRLDRIIGDITIKGEEVPLMKWLAAYGIYSIFNSRSSNNSHSKIMPEICFTGFKSADKTRLELLAIENGFTVRTAVSKNLDFLVYGSNAGPSKMNQAFERAIPCLTEDEFLEMLETGEIPE